MDHGNTVRLMLSGLSSDQKPTEQVESVYLTQGSVFKEIDTSHVYLFDKENKRWVKQTNSASGGNSPGGGSDAEESYPTATAQDIRDLWNL
ncbi:MAG: hypothetical protein NC084_12525 [Bacteroides sp.]|nr:hypothetical protein [Bacteroides sp.]